MNDGGHKKPEEKELPFLAKIERLMASILGLLIAINLVMATIIITVGVPIVIVTAVISLHFPSRHSFDFPLIVELFLTIGDLFAVVIFLISDPKPMTFVTTTFFGISTYIGLFAAMYASCGLYSTHCVPGDLICQTTPTHSGLDALYFSTITLTTVGYGDFVPSNDICRFFAAIEALSGYFLLALIVFAMTKVLSPHKAIVTPKTETTKFDDWS